MIRYENGDISYSYTYDAEGVRRSKQNDNVQGNKITYISDTLCEYSQTLAEINGSGELNTSYTIGLEIISLTRGGEEYYYISDGHGDVRIITDEDGHVKTKYRYSGYGELIETSGDIKNSHMYAGECYDEESGLYYLRARYMNPSTGTFTGMDSYAGNISDPDTLHKYLYANGNPIKYVDPSGNSPTVQEQLTAIGISRELDAQKLIILGGVFNTIVKSTVTFIEGGNVLEIILAAFQGFSFGGLFIAANIIFACIFGVLLVDIFIAEGIGYGYKDIYNAIECFQNGHPEYAWCYIASAAGNFTLAGCLGYIKIKNPSTSGFENYTKESIKKETIINSKGEVYPEVIDIRTGKNMEFPNGVESRVPKENRVGWYRNQREADLYRTSDSEILCKKDYIDEWYKRGYQTPEGGWDLYEIHHILPREFGGGSNFENMVPLLKDVHRKIVTPWWNNY